MVLSRFRRSVGLVLAAAIVCATLSTGPVFAGTTGTISGTVTDAASGAPVVNATVAATSPSGSRTTTTDSKGFYALQALSPDTYLVSVHAKGYAGVSSAVEAFQDETTTNDVALSKALSTIVKVTSRANGSLVKPDTTADSWLRLPAGRFSPQPAVAPPYSKAAASAGAFFVKSVYHERG